MRAEEFVRVVAEAMPSKATLQEHGLSEDEIEGIQATFTVERRASTETAAEATESEVLRLARLFDCSRLEIGLVRFQKAVSVHAAGLRFACLEADALVLASDGEITAYGVGTDVGRPCAATGGHLLDALAEFVRIRRNRSAWKGRVRESAETCASAAGGPRFVDCYRQLCAFLEA